MSKKPKISADDMEIFRKAVDGTRPLVSRKVPIRKTENRKRTDLPEREDQIEYYLDAGASVPDVASEEIISYKHSSISDKILRKLRKGQYNIDAILDLHGMTIEQARYEIVNFITDCLKEGSRVALVVHGKGTHGPKPALKNSVNKWLRQIDVVLAFSSATIQHGGSGAVYVLLKNKADGDS